MNSMTSLLTPEQQAESTATKNVLLVGNPNAGKTALFNALTGLRAKSANYPGITVDVRKASILFGTVQAEIVDVPGLYSLDALSPEEKVTEAALKGNLPRQTKPDVVVLVVDATNLERNLFLVSEVLDLQLPTIVALNLIDAAHSTGIEVDTESLSRELKCPVVAVSSRTGQGLKELREMIHSTITGELPVLETEHISCTAGCSGCTFAARYDWAEEISSKTVKTPETHGRTTDAIDCIVTNPVIGVISFLAVMLGVFYLIFSMADVPMTLIDEGFGALGEVADQLIPAQKPNSFLWFSGVFLSAMAFFTGGFKLSRTKWNWISGLVAIAVSGLISLLPMEDFRSLMIDGVIAGVGGVVIFLPQICILFFFITLLEDSGYMARAAFVMDRLMRTVGLPGKAFVPMLSAHACAIPGIMAARVIENWRDRLVTILVLPLLTCSARLPVYSMVAALLFSESPAQAALVFVCAYVLGIAAALLSAFCLKMTILKGETDPLVLELPPYRLPTIKNALITVFDRGAVFLKKAGTVILLISVGLWALATYPKIPESQITATDENVIAQQQLAYSFAGRAGKAVEPVFQPLGFDWKINIGVISSFAAREVVVSTLAIVYGIGEDAAEDEQTLVETLRSQKKEDGTLVFNTATSLSLLVFYVLAMQCLPTQAVTKRETGSWKWAIFQLVYMTLLAYFTSLIVYQGCVAMGWG